MGFTKWHPSSNTGIAFVTTQKCIEKWSLFQIDLRKTGKYTHLLFAYIQFVTYTNAWQFFWMAVESWTGCLISIYKILNDYFWLDVCNFNFSVLNECTSCVSRSVFPTIFLLFCFVSEVSCIKISSKKMAAAIKISDKRTYNKENSTLSRFMNCIQIQCVNLECPRSCIYYLFLIANM